MKVLKVKEVIQLIESDGWFFVRQKGSHKQYRHATKNGTVTIPGNLNDELPAGTLASIFRQVNLKLK